MNRILSDTSFGDGGQGLELESNPEQYVRLDLSIVLRTLHVLL